MFGGPLAAMSGLLAALASVFSKLALEEEGRTIANVFKHIIASDYDYSVLLLALRIICFMLMFVCNALMWTTFTKALQGVSSTVEVTVTNSSANLFFTAVLGNAVFGEALSLQWWLGASVIVTGLIIIHSTAAAHKVE